MAEIVNIISKLEVDASEVYAELDKVNAKYGQNTEALRKQKEELTSLQKQEAALLAERAKTNSPTIVAQFNKELEKTKIKMDLVNKSMSETKKTTSELGKESNTLKTNLDKAFDETKAVSLKTELRQLKAQLLNTTDPAEFDRLAIAAGKVQYKIKDASQAVAIFANESKSSQAKTLFSQIATSLVNLDFKDASNKAKQFALVMKSVSFKEIISGIKNFGSALINIGDALLKNTFVIIVAAIVSVALAIKGLGHDADAANEILDNTKKSLEGVKDATDNLRKSNRDLALQNEIDRGKITAADGDALKTYNEYLDKRYNLDKEQKEKIKALNEDTAKKEEDKSFLTDIVDIFREETDININHRKSLALINDDFNEQDLELLKELSLKLKSQGINFANEEAKRIKEENKKKIEEAQALSKKLRDLEISNITDDSSKQRATATAKYNDEYTAAKGNVKLIAELRRQLDKELTAIDDAEKKRHEDLLKSKIEASKTYAEEEILIAELNTNNEVDSYSAKIGAAIKHYQGLIDLTKENSEERKALELKLKLELAKIDKDDQTERYNRLDADLAEQQRHAAAMLSIQTKDKEALKVQLLAIELAAEKERLENLKASGIATEAQITKQNNKIAELQAEYDSEIKKLDDEKREKILDNIKIVVDAVVAAARQIIAIEIEKLDKQINTQQKRVDQITKIAENGNTILLEQERDRLEKLTKQREKYVRAQQALAALELIANTAVAVSKAASQGGVAAAVTIAAAIIALVAGLATARSIASQAAFFKGGESDGYTGDGNIHSESNTVGSKPYTYHKKEFIFNNEKTSKYLDLFRKAHKGEIDLNKIKFESDMYKTLKTNGIDTSREVRINSMPAQHSDMAGIKSSLYQVVEAINSQERMKVTIDERGIEVIASKYIKNKKRINSFS